MVDETDDLTEIGIYSPPPVYLKQRLAESERRDFKISIKEIHTKASCSVQEKH